jgi:cytochrome c-type biogenesis protein
MTTLSVNEVSLMAAFVAGLFSFVSPCVLPLVPGYISFVSGISLEDIEKGEKQNKNTIIISSLFFIFGFSLIFILLGATATFLGSFLLEKAFILKKIGGIIIIIFGIHMSGLYRIKFLDYEKRIYSKTKPVNIIVGPFLMGCLCFWLDSLYRTYSGWNIDLCWNSGNSLSGYFIANYLFSRLGNPFFIDCSGYQ